MRQRVIVQKIIAESQRQGLVAEGDNFIFEDKEADIKEFISCVMKRAMKEPLTVAVAKCKDFHFSGE